MKKNHNSLKLDRKRETLRDKDQTDFRCNISDSYKDGCIFCNVLRSQKFLVENDLAVAILDGHPVTKGHTLVISKRHVSDYFEITESERKAINDLLCIWRRELLVKDHDIEGFNIGINIGEAAGQSVFHAHVHLIPRRLGDTPKPMGGVRGVISKKMNY